MSNINSNISNALDTLTTETLNALAHMKAREIRAELKAALGRKANGSSKTAYVPTPVPVPAPVPSAREDDNDTEICEVPEAIPTPIPETGDSFVITVGSKPGFVEIRFSDKPDGEVRTVLKRAGFRFTHKVFENGRVAKGKRDPRWYGKAARIPAMFKSALARAA